MNNTNKYLKFRNTYFEKLPEELIDYIWEFNYYHAAVIINYYARKYICNSILHLRDFHILHLREMVKYAYEPESTISIENYKFFYRNRLMDKNDVFLRMRACQCCKRHQILKPKILKPWINTDFHNSQFTSCECICRHYSRLLCRSVRLNNNI